MRMRFEKQKARLQKIKADIESKLLAAKKKDDIILQKARQKLETLEKHAPDKAALFKQHIKKIEAKLAAKASTRENKAKSKIEKEERKLAELKEK